MSRKHGGRKLRPEEEALWNKVADTTNPLKKSAASDKAIENLTPDPLKKIREPARPRDRGSASGVRQGVQARGRCGCVRTGGGAPLPAPWPAAASHPCGSTAPRHPAARSPVHARPRSSRRAGPALPAALQALCGPLPGSCAPSCPTSRADVKGDALFAIVRTHLPEGRIFPFRTLFHVFHPVGFHSDSPTDLQGVNRLLSVGISPRRATVCRALVLQRPSHRHSALWRVRPLGPSRQFRCDGEKTPGTNPAAGQNTY